MKITHQSTTPHGSKDGSTLTVTIVSVAVLSIAVSSVLALALHERRAAARSAAWNAALPVAEAGIEEALAHLERWGTGSLAVGEWQSRGSNVFVARSLDKGRYETSIVPGVTPIIISKGFVPAPLGLGEVSRTVEVRAFQRPMFPTGLFATRQMRLGGAFLADSFDSEDTNYSVDGQYDPSRRKDNGNLATNGRADLDVDVGATAQVYGRVDTGPGGSLDVGGASVGSAPWVDSGNKGIEPGRNLSDVNVSFPDAELPFQGGAFAPVAEVVDQVQHKYVLSSGNYRLSSLKLSGEETMLVRGNSTLLIEHDVALSGSGTVLIEPEAQLRLFVRSGLLKPGGGSIMNRAGSAEDFSLVGLPGLRDIKIAGNGTFIGTIYAPQTRLNLSGGGTDPLDFVGAAVVRDADTSGHYEFHYDEALNRKQDGLFVITSWREI